MPSDAVLTLLILGVTVGLFIWNRYPVEIVAIASSLALFFVGVVDLPQMLSGYADPAVVMIAALFVVSEGLEVTGVTAWVGQLVASKSRGSSRRALVLIMLLGGLMSALIGINGAVAALLPMAVVISMRLRTPASLLLMPLAFAGSSGALLLLTGSPVNVIVSQAAGNAGFRPIGLLEFALIGVPVLAGTIAMVLLFGHRLLPERDSSELPPDLSGYARTLAQHYSLDRVSHVRLTRSSRLVGTPRADCVARRWPGVRVITVHEGIGGRPTTEGTFGVNDRLTVLGDPEAVGEFADQLDMEVEGSQGLTEVSMSLMNRDEGVIEVVVPPRSRFLDHEVHPGSVLRGSVVVLAVQREGRDRGDEDSMLRTGDALLLEGPWSSLDSIAADDDVLVVNAPDLLRRQAVPRGSGSNRALLILAAMVVLLASGLVPPVIAALLAAGAMVVTRVVSAQEVYRRMSWSTVLMVAAMFPMSTAIQQSGAGAMIADRLVGAVGGFGAYALLSGLVLLCFVFGQLISNTATALVMIPIGLAAASSADISGRTVLISLCVACAAAFLTPVATPANLMVMGPAGYRFGDYWKLGLPLLLLFFVAAVFVVPLIWGLEP